MGDPDPKDKSQRTLPKVAASGLELLGAVGVFCLLGYWFDRKFKTDPWGILIGAVFGIVGGLYNMIRPALHRSFRSMKGRDQKDRSADNRKK